jgi:sugar phosphate permease
VYYTGRKGLSVAKKTLHDRLGVSEAALGAIDTAYLGAYAIGQLLSGLLGDRIGARRLIGYGMLLSAGACAGFGCAGGALLFGVAFLANGFAQSTGWPGTTRAMAEWTTRENRGTVMALWATCYQVGGILASLLAGYVLVRAGWRAVFLVPALLLAVVGVLVLLLLPSSEPRGAEVRLARGAAQRQVLRSPTLWCYGLSYFFIKFIRYALLFWLPYYLAQQLGYAGDRAAYVSTAFEVGGIAGTIGIGLASDRLRRYPRSALAAPVLVALATALLAYTWLGGAGVWSNVAGLALIGATLFGPDSLISGAASQDVGGEHAVATATGFVNALGSVGSMLVGLVVPALAARHG